MFTMIIILIMAVLVSYFLGFMILELMTEGPMENELNWSNIICSIIIGAIVLLFWALH